MRLYWLRDIRVWIAFVLLGIDIGMTLTVPPDRFLTSSTYPTLYGALWALLNPFYHDATIYPFVTVFWEIVSFVILLTLCVKGRMYWSLFRWSQMMTMLWAQMQWTQNITVTMLFPLVAIFPPFILFMIFQKFPLGWSWTLTDPHWQSYNQLGTNNFTNICTGLDYHTWCNATNYQPMWLVLSHHALGYFLLLFSFVVPLLFYVDYHTMWLERPKKWIHRLEFWK